MYFAGHNQQDSFLSAYICNTQVCYTGWFKVTLQKNWFAKTVDKKNLEATNSKGWEMNKHLLITTVQFMHFGMQTQPSQWKI